VTDGWRRRNPQPDITALRKFERIRQQILQNLIQSLRVGVNRWRQFLIDVDLESEPFAFGHVPKGSFQVLLHLLEPNFAHVHGHCSGLDLGKIEDVVDQLKQVDT
jgi:hypothetical protein